MRVYTAVAVTTVVAGVIGIVGIVIVVILVGIVIVVVVVVLVGIVIVVFPGVIVVIRRERNRLDPFRDLKHRRPRILNRRERVDKLKFQIQSVGHHKVGVLHALAVLKRRLESVGVATDRNNRLNIGNSTTGHIGDNIGPDTGCH